MKRAKNILTRSMAMIMCLITALTAGSLIACGPKEKPQGDIAIDSSKQQIYYYYYAGGVDHSWRVNAAKEWNATNDTYQVIPWPTLTENFQQELVVNGGQASIIDITSSEISDYINANNLADLTDLYEKSVDGDGVKIKDKMHNYDKWQKLYSTNEYPNGIYALPGGDSPMHLIYDHDLFMEKGWLIYQKDEHGAPIRDDEGKVILSVGQDGKAGTYDDGQPVNMAEWEEMLGRIKIANNTKAFIFTTKYNFYLEPLIKSLIAQYGGYEAYMSMMMGEGFYYDENGQKVEKTYENGYELYDNPALLKAMQFMDKYFTTSEWVHEKSVDSTGFAHKETVNTFITGFNPDVQQAAFLVEGSYFEIENKYYFNLLKQNKYEGRGYGEREYRLMLLPRLSEYDDVSYLCGQGVSATLISRDTKNPNKEAAAKDFMAFTLQEKYLKERTICSVSVMPYEYSLTPEEKANLTPFQRNVLDVCLDTENIKLISVADSANDIVRQGKVGKRLASYTFTAMMPDGGYERPLLALRRYSAVDYVAGIKKHQKEKMWGIK